jgi:hypothetical protein
MMSSLGNCSGLALPWVPITAKQTGRFHGLIPAIVDLHREASELLAIFTTIGRKLKE